jgi:hypothetical protein
VECAAIERDDRVVVGVVKEEEGELSRPAWRLAISEGVEPRDLVPL